MQIPVIRGIIDRCILFNFRVEAHVLARQLPAPFRPKLVNGYGMAGVCLIRFRGIRPRFVPSFLGISSENAAHRIAVEWDHDGETKKVVFIPRRDTSSRLNTLVGGRLLTAMTGARICWLRATSPRSFRRPPFLVQSRRGLISSSVGRWGTRLPGQNRQHPEHRPGEPHHLVRRQGDSPGEQPRGPDLSRPEHQSAWQ